MTSLTKLAAKLPDDNEANGLDHFVGQFRREPHVPVVAIVTLSVQKLITDYEKSTVSPVVQVESIEVLGTSIDVPPALLDMLAAARSKRLRQDPLPITEPESAAPLPATCITCGHDADEHVPGTVSVDGEVLVAAHCAHSLGEDEGVCSCEDRAVPACAGCGHDWTNHTPDDEDRDFVCYPANDDGSPCECGGWTAPVCSCGHTYQTHPAMRECHECGAAGGEGEDAEPACPQFEEPMLELDDDTIGDPAEPIDDEAE